MSKKFINAKWIGYKTDPGDKADNLNPWENPIDENTRSADIKNGTGIPVFRKRFALSDGVKKCVMNISAMGCFNVYANGRKVGNDELMPGWTDFTKRVMYYTYDITDIVSRDNAVAVPVSSGWWAGRISLNTYGDNDTAVICEIETEYENGTKETVNSDLTWDVITSGCVRYADIWDGEVYDANFDTFETVSEPGYTPDKACRPYEFDSFKGVISPKIGPSVRIRDFLDMKPVTAVIYDKIINDGTDFGKINVTESAERPFAGRGTVKLAKGSTLVLDMGQNMVGWEHFTVRGNKNTTINIRHAEMLNDSGSLSRANDGPNGSVYTANYRSAKARGKYILRGDAAGEEYRPAFTFYGFRYVEMTASDDIEILAFKCDVVGSDNRETGFIETSNEDVNKLISNIIWGQRGNYLSVPTDCPQRDERLGWTGDTQIFARTGAYNADVLEFFRKWLQDARDSQSEAGAYSDVVPRSRVVGEGNAAWGDAGILVPYVMYLMYGDVSIIEECWESMEKYMGYLDNTNLDGPHPTYGDWLAYEPTDNKYLSIAYYAYDAIIMSKMARVLSKKDEAEKYEALYWKIREHFDEIYTDGDGRLTQTSQTAYLLAIKMGLLSEERAEEAGRLLMDKIKNNGYKLSTGFVGTGVLNQTLSRHGYDSLAYSLLLQTANPSWLYSVHQGATTIWERWNSYTKESGFGNVGMNSFNHYAYGSVMEWMYRYMAGIDTDEKEPGFRHIILHPRPDVRTDDEMPEGQTRITWVRAHYDSAAGRIESSWNMEESTFSYTACVPEGARTTLYMPVFTEEAKTITIDGEVYEADGFRREKGCLVIELTPGRHSVEALR